MARNNLKMYYMVGSFPRTADNPSNPVPPNPYGKVTKNIDYIMKRTETFI